MSSRQVKFTIDLYGEVVYDRYNRYRGKIFRERYGDISIREYVRLEAGNAVKMLLGSNKKWPHIANPQVKIDFEMRGGSIWFQDSGRWLTKKGSFNLRVTVEGDLLLRSLEEWKVWFDTKGTSRTIEQAFEYCLRRCLEWWPKGEMVSLDMWGLDGYLGTITKVKVDYAHNRVIEVEPNKEVSERYPKKEFPDMSTQDRVGIPCF